jgi:ATP-dependent RNA helicase RhlE
LTAKQYLLIRKAILTMAYNNQRSFSRGPRPTQSRGNFGMKRQNRSRVNNKKYIHPSRFINQAIQKSEEIPYQPENEFSDFGFNSQIIFNIESKGYKTMTQIQDQVIQLILDGKDVVGLANTGTGKTAAFLLPILNRQTGVTLKPRVIIIAPTRELAQQIDEQFRDFSKGLGLYSALIVGGMPIERQIRELKRRPNFIIGTPGRIKDLINRRYINLATVNTVVLDEADRMLDMGFLPDIKNIVSMTPTDRQTLLFSATITPDIARIIADFTNDAVTIQARTSETNEHIEQDVVEYRDKTHKVELLVEMLSGASYDKVLVFGETKYGVQRLSDHLDNSGFPSVAIHGNKNQSQRQRALKRFKVGEARIMVATDVAARGLDIPNVSHVINFDTPQCYEDYVHRIGRTGRAGASGKAFTFIESRR